MKKERYIGSVLNIFLVVSILVPLVLISFTAVNYSQKYLRELSKKNSVQIINNLKVSLEVFFKEPENNLKILRDVIEQNSLETSSNIDDYAEILINNETKFRHFRVVDNDGIVSYSYPVAKEVIGFDYSRNESFMRIKEGYKSYWSKTYVEIAHDEIVIDYALPLGQQVLIGTVHLDLLSDIADIIADKNNLIVGITDDSGVYLVNTDIRNVQQRKTDLYVNQYQLNYSPVKIDGIKYYGTTIKSDYQDWNIVFYEEASVLDDKLQRYIWLIIIGTFVLTGIVMIIGSFINSKIKSNLLEVVTQTKKVATGEYLLETKKSIFIEFNQISDSFMLMAKNIGEREKEIIKQRNEIEEINNDLENRVVDRTMKLSAANDELEATLEELSDTQDQLIESEKMASLSTLMVGLAHEINTPLGVIITIITYLQEETNRVFTKLKTSQLKKSELANFLEQTVENENFIFDNVMRTNELIENFKMISSDQRSAELREVDLGDYINKVILGIRPQLKKYGIVINFECKEVIKIRTVPIGIYQIIVNILMNAKIHAYNYKPGIVNISIAKTHHGAKIVVEDFGVGVRPDGIKKIFEPFYTTNRGQGGTGLGLNIVYNTVKQDLQGDIICKSEFGVGTKFIVTIPNIIMRG